MSTASVLGELRHERQVSTVMKNRFRPPACGLIALTVLLASGSSSMVAEMNDREDCIQQEMKSIAISCTYYDRKFSGQGTVPAWNYDRELIKRLDLKESDDGTTIDPYRDEAEQDPARYPNEIET